MTTPLKIAMIISECVPFAKVGGLADVGGALPWALQAMGHDVIVILPKYACVDPHRYNLRPFLMPLRVQMGGVEEQGAVHIATHQGISVYFIELDKYFNRSAIYGSNNVDYGDNELRFGFFARAALQLCHCLGFVADVIHAHDWLTALVPAYLKIWHHNDPVLGNAISILTAHNVYNQGIFETKSYDYLGLQRDNLIKFEDHGMLNFLKGGIQFADMVTAVSPTYAKETRQLKDQYALATYLDAKGESYVGILNGADYAEWNPAVDKRIPARFSPEDMSGKTICKRELQRYFALEASQDVPLIGAVGNFFPNKGFHLLAEAIERIVAKGNVQFVILGGGDRKLESFYSSVSVHYPEYVGSYFGFNDELAHWIEAGADFIILPSISEPSGVNQIYALKYGTLPIVRATGGLDDTVQQYDEATGLGTGFKFWEPSAHAIGKVVDWAVSTYYERQSHFHQMRQAAMAQDFSWERSAKEYIRVYERAIVDRKSDGRHGTPSAR